MNFSKPGYRLEIRKYASVPMVDGCNRGILLSENNRLQRAMTGPAASCRRFRSACIMLLTSACIMLDKRANLYYAAVSVKFKVPQGLIGNTCENQGWARRCDRGRAPHDATVCLTAAVLKKGRKADASKPLPLTNKREGAAARMIRKSEDLP